jgi:cytoskeletal protein CcmA (bactofilin family)
MAIWPKDTTPRKDSPMPDASFRADPPQPQASSAPDARRPAARGGESVIAAGITIDGTIQGSGHVRVAGRFTGDIQVDGDLTIEQGARVTGGVRAVTVTIAGELEGNIDGAARVELKETGVLAGDLKAGSLTVAAGSRMRGQVEFGWEERAVKAPAPRDGVAVA